MQLVLQLQQVDPEPLAPTTVAVSTLRPLHRDRIAWTGSGTPGIRRHIKQPDEYARRHRGAAKAKC